jgi:hypothetical protein
MKGPPVRGKRDVVSWKFAAPVGARRVISGMSFYSLAITVARKHYATPSLACSLGEPPGTREQVVYFESILGAFSTGFAVSNQFGEGQLSHASYWCIARKCICARKGCETCLV